MYNFRNSKANIINILKSKTPIEEKDRIQVDSTFTYENGISCWISAIFVDIENSTKLFKKKDEKLARLIRAFTSEIITIMQDDESLYNEIGIRGDCVYGIYSTSQKDHIVRCFDIACRINTFMKMFNEIIVEYGYEKIKVGIGLGCSKDLIIKAGRKGTGINDKIWIGKAIVDASNLSSIAGRGNIRKIAMDECFYNNIIHEYINNKYYFKHEINYKYGNYYHCNLVQRDFNNWIDRGMKDE